MHVPKKDIREIGQPEVGQPDDGRPDDESLQAERLQALEVPEPLVIPPEQLREHYQKLIDEEADQEHVHYAEFIKVRSKSKLWPYMSLSMRTYNSRRQAPGFLAGGIRAKWWRGSFWTYSVWEDEGDLKRFMESRASTAAAAWIRRVAGPGSCYVTWVTKDEADWTEAIARLERPTRYYVDPWMG